MKNNDLDMERLLAAVEHEGRDERRRQALGDMIDRLAADEAAAARRTRRLWTVRAAAAASVALFVLTAVRVWLAPAGGDGATLVAEAVATPAARVVNDSVAPTAPAAVLPVNPARRKPTVCVPPAPVADEASMPADEVAAVGEETAVTVEETYAEAVGEPVADSAWRPAAEAPVPAPPVAEENGQPPRRNLLGSLFRRSRPSRMDGTMLAINLL